MNAHLNHVTIFTTCKFCSVVVKFYFRCALKKGVWYVGIFKINNVNDGHFCENCIKKSTIQIYKEPWFYTILRIYKLNLWCPYIRSIIEVNKIVLTDNEFNTLCFNINNKM